MTGGARCKPGLAATVMPLQERRRIMMFGYGMGYGMGLGGLLLLVLAVLAIAALVKYLSK